MTRTRNLERWRADLLPVAVAGAALAFWRPLYDNFALAKVTVVWLAAVVVVGFTVTRWLIDGEVRVPTSRFIAMVAVVFGAMVLAVATSGWRWTSLVGIYPRWTGLASYASYMALGVVAFRHADAMTVGRLLRWLVYSGIVVSGYALVQVVGADPFTWTAENVPEIFSTMGNVNFASAFVALTFPAAIWLVTRQASTRLDRGSGVLALMAGLPALFAIGSLQGYVVALVTTSTTLAGVGYERSENVRRALRHRVTHVAGAGLGLTAVAAAAMGWERLFGSLGIGFQERVYFYQAGLRILADHLAFGTGLDTYGHVFTRYQPVAHALQFRDAVPDAPHSVPLGMFTGGGVLLGLAYLALVAFVAGRAIGGLRERNRERHLVLVAAASVWLGYQLQSLISIDEPPLAVIHWVMAGSVVGLVESRETREWRLPWGPTTTKKGRKIQRQSGLPATARVGLGAVLVVTLLAAWIALRPVRADLAAEKGRTFGAAAAQQPRAVERSEQELERAHQLAPQNGTYWFLHALVRYDRGDISGALEAQESAAHHSPGQPLYAANAALFARQLGRTDEAAIWWLEAAARDPNNPERLLAAARFHADAGDAEVAEGLARRVLALQPGSQQARELLVSLDASDTE